MPAEKTVCKHEMKTYVTMQEQNRTKGRSTVEKATLTLVVSDFSV